MIILAIDPGPEQSGWVVYDSGTKLVLEMGLDANEFVRLTAKTAYLGARCAIEWIQSYGMKVGQSTFETCRWVGRFEEARRLVAVYNPALMFRKDVKLHLCGNCQANDTSIRIVLTDRYGGSRQKAVGTKANPGPLYGIKADIWQALALAITFAETR